MTDQLPILKRRRTARPRTAAELSEAYPISIIIPFYNAFDQLSKTLTALSQNDLRHTEVLLIDDGSTDGTARWPKEIDLGVACKIIRLSSKSGPAAARNRGLRESQYPHVFFLDADVVLPANTLFWIRETFDIYRHRPEIRGVLGVYSTDLTGAGFFTHYKNLYTRYLYDTTETLSPFVHTPIFCVHKQTLQEVGGFDSRLETAEDFRLGICLGSRGYRFVIDRRIEGIHLKTYSAKAILREDRRRISDLRRVELATEEKDFYFRAHRWSRLLSVLLPGATAGCVLLSLQIPGFRMVALFLALLFYGLNLRFLKFCWKKQGLFFALSAACFLPLEMAWASLAGLESSLRDRRLRPAQSQVK